MIGMYTGVAARRSITAAAIAFPGRPLDDRRQNAAEVQRHFDRCAAAQILTQAAGNVIPQRAAAVTVNERFEQGPRGGRTVRTTALRTSDELYPAVFDHLGHAMIVWWTGDLGTRRHVSLFAKASTRGPGGRKHSPVFSYS